METSFYQSLGISQGHPMIFFRRPISAVLLSLVFLLLAALYILKTVQNGRGPQDCKSLSYIIVSRWTEAVDEALKDPKAIGWADGVQGRSFTAVTNLFRDVLLSANSVLEVTS